MNRINFTSKTSYPLSSDTLDFMQNMSHSLEKLVTLGGDNYILSGCVVNGTNVSEGYIVHEGQLMRFEKGTLMDTYIISKDEREIVALGETYPAAEVTYTARFGTGADQYPWSSLRRITDLLSIKDAIDSINLTIKGLSTVPSGVISAYGGSTAPSGWVICDGRELSIAEYPNLYKAIGTLYGGNTLTFRVPNLGGRFVVGVGRASYLSSGDPNPTYRVGNIGGETTHKLTISEMPKHTHKLDNSKSTSKTESFCYARGANYDSNARLMSPEGGDERHENRPPYYALNYIIKL